jgi:hypothetical protein
MQMCITIKNKEYQLRLGAEMRQQTLYNETSVYLHRNLVNKTASLCGKQSLL